MNQMLEEPWPEKAGEEGVVPLHLDNLDLECC